MRERFFQLAGKLERELRAGETLLCNLSGERSDFVRFNHGRVRQAGSVEQAYVTARLIRDGRQAAATFTVDSASAETIGTLRALLADLPQDPWLLVNEAPQSTTIERRGALPSAREVTGEVISAAKRRDLVGIYSAGTVYRGFANSLGQKNWHEVDSFNFDCSLYLEADKAVKTSYAGFEWDRRQLENRLEAAAKQLEFLARPRRTIERGEYRAFLAPRALDEIAGLLAWGGFSARSRATKQSPLLRMEAGETLSRNLSLSENTAEGIAPGFQAEGFLKPPRVTLIEAGELRDPLVSPRSAKEYGLVPNAGRESPESLDIAPGNLEDPLAALDTGLLIGNLWYLNFSDRPAGRITGMTRFATFWVEGGRIVAPVTPMRFDDSVYRMLGANLVDLTRERELLPDPSTYGERSTSSSRLPGALVAGLRFTL